MRALLLRWITTAVPLLLGVSVLTFVLASLVPGDAARSMLGVNATPQQYKQLRDELRLDEPLWQQYWSWLTGAMRGDLGQSLQSSDSVSHELVGRLPVTLWLVAGAVLFAVVLGIGLGVAGAVRGGWVGRVVDAISLVGLAIPTFWLGLVLVTLFAVQTQVFPATGYVAFADSPLRWFESLVLPVLTLGIGSAAPIAQQTRDGVLAEQERDYVSVLRARGISEKRILLHVLRNAGTPVLSVVGLVATGLFGGAVLAEIVFVMPGLGSLVVNAAATHDIPVIQGVAVVFTLLVVVVNLLVELGYGALNPKVRT
ncbi:ABC transporter permease [Streptomyces sp. NPDC057718]|uniref:ABC transporter permease n=1 Tax=Streptomyces sp. NPDC057718 TaxID=3346225 RepID=UPI0036B55F0B